MTLTAPQITQLVQAELSALTDSRVINHIRTLLVPPEPRLRAWDYGADGEAYPCWSVLNHQASNTGIAYCASGFGPRTPWGLVFLEGTAHMSMGMDSGWFEHFLQAYFDSMVATELPIWRVFRTEATAFAGVAITEEAGWDATWKEVERLRSVDPGSRYHCSQSLYVPRES